MHAEVSMLIRTLRTCACMYAYVMHIWMNFASISCRHRTGTRVRRMVLDQRVRRMVPDRDQSKVIMCMRMRMRMRMYMCMYMLLCMRMSMCMCMCVCVCVYVCMYMCVYAWVCVMYCTWFNSVRVCVGTFMPKYICKNANKCVHEYSRMLHAQRCVYWQDIISTCTLYA
jgi:hypothetical protein